MKVTCAHPGIKWQALKAINSAKPNGVYAKCFMTPDEIRKDRLLRLKLKEYRDGDKSGRFKIKRDEIVKLNPDTNEFSEAVYKAPSELPKGGESNIKSTGQTVTK